LGPREEKIFSGEFTSQRGGGWQLAQNIKQAGALLGGIYRAGGRKTLRFHVPEIARSLDTEEREGRAAEGDDPWRGPSERAPERWPIPREHFSPRLGVKSWVAMKGNGFPGGIKPL
jgi:hypothetical protein